jgi:hypothetical protein
VDKHLALSINLICGCERSLEGEVGGMVMELEAKRFGRAPHSSGTGFRGSSARAITSVAVPVEICCDKDRYEDCDE